MAVQAAPGLMELITADNAAVDSLATCLETSTKWSSEWIIKQMP
jgi:hypothetical protein